MMAVQKASLCSGLFIAPALTEACQRGRREPQTLIKPSRAEPTAQKNTRAGDADLQLIIVAIISILINILNRRVNKNALTPRRHICCRGGGGIKTGFSFRAAFLHESERSTATKLQRNKPTFFRRQTWFTG